MSKIIRGTALAVAAALIVSAGLSTQTVAQTKILVHIFAPPQYPNNSHGWVYLKKNIERDTQGRVTFQFTNGKVGPPPRNWNLVTRGTVDAAYLHTGFERKRLWLPEIGRLTGLTPTATAMSVASWRTYKKFFEKANEFKGVKLLSLYSFSGENVWSRSKPVNNIDDLKGMKLRTGAGLAANILKALEVAPVPSLAAEIFPLVSKGVVDGMTGPAALVKVLKVDQFIKHGTIFPGSLFNLVWTPILSKKKWDGISKSDQKIIEKYLGEGLGRSVAGEWDRRNTAAKIAMAKAGVKITQANPDLVAAVNKKVARFTDEWFERAKNRGVDGPAALAFYKEQLKSLK